MEAHTLRGDKREEEERKETKRLDRQADMLMKKKPQTNKRRMPRGIDRENRELLLMPTGWTVNLALTHLMPTG